ncbi:MAG: WbuC family cupin fold metalloprotein [Candidatus Omnitrophica bacterium]|nr:WbuC family cupin fold metalloprotein [Candidatus Omnitrophota bacterium]
MLPHIMLTPEVAYPEDSIVKVSSADIAGLKALAQANPRRRVRLCAHPSTDDTLHEMLIVHEQGTYVRPHRHPGKSESFHIIEGLADVVIFTDEGEISEVISMGPYSSDLVFFYRLGPSLFHTLLIRSLVLVFHETTNGPFRRADLVFAPWAPDECDTADASDFMSHLCQKLGVP